MCNRKKRNEQINKNFTQAINMILASENMTLIGLTRKLNIRYASMWEYVRGKRKRNPSHENLTKVIEAYPQYISIIFNLDIPKQVKK